MKTDYCTSTSKTRRRTRQCYLSRWGQRKQQPAKKEVLQAKEARQAMGLIGNPSKNDFKGMVSNDYK